jgi:sterol desaturase/sphingolipid hydroxylase (fatty acid hydroxylase superfamily)
MFAEFAQTAVRLLQIFAASLTTSFFICKVSSKPFFCEDSNYPTVINKIKYSIIDYSAVYLQAVTIGTVLFPLLDKNPHSLIRMASNMAEYSLWIELFYYVYHRAIHTQKIYKWVHAKHHENRVVYPIDTVYISVVDSIGLMFTLAAPMWFVQVNVCEYGTIIYIYLTGAFLSHSDIIMDHHSTHHREFKCNYCFLFPVFDILCGTYK